MERRLFQAIVAPVWLLRMDPYLKTGKNIGRSLHSHTKSVCECHCLTNEWLYRNLYPVSDITKEHKVRFTGYRQRAKDKIVSKVQTVWLDGDDRKQINMKFCNRLEWVNSKITDCLVRLSHVAALAKTQCCSILLSSNKFCCMVK